MVVDWVEVTVEWCVARDALEGFAAKVWEGYSAGSWRCSKSIDGTGNSLFEEKYSPARLAQCVL
jgi:hypothetical protein